MVAPCYKKQRDILLEKLYETFDGKRWIEVLCEKCRCATGKASRAAVLLRVYIAADIETLASDIDEVRV